MYKALEMYPLTNGMTYEQSIRTNYVRARTKAVDYFLLERGSTMKELLEYAGLRDFNGNTSINGYLKAGEFFGWDLSRDINYIYANVLYEPDEIERRICRVYDWKRVTASHYDWLAESLGTTADKYISAVQYMPDRSSHVYAAIMQWIMSMERENGYSDALDIEE